MQTDQGVRKVTNWKKALEGTCKCENVSDNGANLDVKELELVEWIHISRIVGWTDAVTGNETDFIGKNFRLIKLGPCHFSWRMAKKKTDFNLSSDRCLKFKQKLKLSL